MVAPVPLLKPITEPGNWGHVQGVVLASGGCPALDFLHSELDAKGQAKCLVVFQGMADAGRVSSKRFDAKMDGLHAFSFEIGNKQVRFPCFRDGNSWILTHGFFKPGAKRGLGEWPQSQIDRANNIRSTYYARKQNTHVKQPTKRR